MPWTGPERSLCCVCLAQTAAGSADPTDPGPWMLLLELPLWLFLVKGYKTTTWPPALEWTPYGPCFFMEHHCCLPPIPYPVESPTWCFSVSTWLGQGSLFRRFRKVQALGEVGCAQMGKQLMPTVEEGSEEMTDWSLILCYSLNTGEHGFYLWTKGFPNTTPELDRRLLGTLLEGNLLPEGWGWVFSSWVKVRSWRSYVQ